MSRKFSDSEIEAGMLYLGVKNATLELIAEKFKLGSTAAASALLSGCGVPVRPRGRQPGKAASNANKKGKALEAWVGWTLDKNGISHSKHKYTHPVEAYRPAKKNKKGKSSEIEFSLADPYGNNLLIDCKNQATTGSAEEKLWFTAWNHSHLNSYKVIILTNGVGWRKGFLELAKDVFPKMYSNLIGVMNMKDFLSYMKLVK